MSESRVAVQPVKIQRLDPESFAPFGSVIDEEKLTFPESDAGEGRVAFEKFTMKRSKLTREIIGFHFSYTQAVIVLSGKLGLAVAPPPSNPAATLENADIDYDKLMAFEIHAGEAVLIGRGVWHDLLSLDDSCTVLHLTRRLTDKRGSTPAENINTRERDNRVIELQPVTQHAFA